MWFHHLGTMPSSRAACVAARASSIRAFRSFISVSVAAPTLIWATPPAKLGKTLLELLAIVLAVSLIDLTANLLDTAFDVGLLATATNDRGRFAGDANLLGNTEIGKLDALQIDTEILEDCLTASQDSDVAQELLCVDRRSQVL